MLFTTGLGGMHDVSSDLRLLTADRQNWRHTAGDSHYEGLVSDFFGDRRFDGLNANLNFVGMCTSTYWRRVCTKKEGVKGVVGLPKLGRSEHKEKFGNNHIAMG